MINISAFGLKALVKASNTFPSGFNISAFSDDADPLDNPDFVAADTNVALNGDMVVWSRPSGIEISFNVIPTSQDDVNLNVLLEANRVGKGKTGARDVCSVVASFPSGISVSYSKGAIVSGSLNPSVANSGRIKTRRYTFRFESVVQTGATAQEV